MRLEDVSCVLSSFTSRGLMVTGGSHDTEGQCEVREEKQSGRA